MRLTNPSTNAVPIDYPIQKCSETVTVKIDLPAEVVACPGHPLEITAKGEPGGGTYHWTVSGGTAQLVNSGGKKTTTGATVYLRAFKADDATGNIPAQKATVGVTYKHPNGSPTDSRVVDVHQINFVVVHPPTNPAVTTGSTEVTENDYAVVLGPVFRGSPVSGDSMATEPEVTIQLGESCPVTRKRDCARNHRVGWLQTVRADDRRARYTHTLVKVDVKPPVLDGGPRRRHPFFDDVKPFADDKATLLVPHFDSPEDSADWIDPRSDAPKPPPSENLQLREVCFSTSYTAWLVVQNIEWSKHKPEEDPFAYKDSFAYLEHFDWGVRLNVEVNTAAKVGERCTPRSGAAWADEPKPGRGQNTPVLTGPSANKAAKKNKSKIEMPTYTTREC